MFLLRNTNILTLSGFRWDLKWVTIWPDELNKHLEAELVAQYLRAILASIGNVFSFSFHQGNGSSSASNIGMLRYFSNSVVIFYSGVFDSACSSLWFCSLSLKKLPKVFHFLRAGCRHCGVAAEEETGSCSWCVDSGMIPRVSIIDFTSACLASVIYFTLNLGSSTDETSSSWTISSSLYRVYRLFLIVALIVLVSSVSSSSSFSMVLLSKSIKGNRAEIVT